MGLTAPKCSCTPTPASTPSNDLSVTVLWWPSLLGKDKNTLHTILHSYNFSSLISTIAGTLLPPPPSPSPIQIGMLWPCLWFAWGLQLRGCVLPTSFGLRLCRDFFLLDLLYLRFSFFLVFFLFFLLFSSLLVLFLDGWGDL